MIRFASYFNFKKQLERHLNDKKSSDIFEKSIKQFFVNNLNEKSTIKI